MNMNLSVAFVGFLDSLTKQDNLTLMAKDKSDNMIMFSLLILAQFLVSNFT